jgi:hypothetical protein
MSERIASTSIRAALAGQGASAEAPVGDRAGELWDHVRWLVEMDGFYELKRTRDRKPGLTPAGQP